MLKSIGFGIIVVCAGFLLSCDSPQTETFEDKYERVAVSILSSYDLEVPELQVRQFSGLPDAMAKTVCRIREQGPVCEVVFKPCAVEIRNMNTRENLIAHELAHYVNARVNSKFDHGEEWEQILRDHGYEPIEEYPRYVTRSC